MGPFELIMVSKLAKNKIFKYAAKLKCGRHGKLDFFK